MHIDQLYQIVAIAHYGSISKAANATYTTHSTLSRHVKSVENEYHIKLFTRGPNGVELTDEGTRFIEIANKIISAQEELETSFINSKNTVPVLRVSMNKSSYSSQALCKFLNNKSNHPCKIEYKEDDTLTTIDDVALKNYGLGFIRFDKRNENHYIKLLSGKGLSFQKFVEHKNCILCSKKSPLAKLDSVSLDDVKNYTEVIYAGQYWDSLNHTITKREQLMSHLNDQVFFYDRTTLYNVLKDDINAFSVAFKPRKEVMDLCDLTCVDISDNESVYCDCLIFKIGKSFTEVEAHFVDCIKEAIKEML